LHSARDVRKAHPTRLDAFSSGDAGPLGRIENAAVALARPWPADGEAIGIDRLPAEGADWPQVQIVTSHAGASGALVQALCASGVQGLVVAGTGNGTVHRDLHDALVKAQAAGVRVLRSSRCGNGRVLATAADLLPSADDLPPAKARVELMLQLLESAPKARRFR
jgi:L-asparaginase